MLNCDDRLVRRWVSGDGTVPPDISDWLTDLAAAHAAAPPPQAWRRRRTDAKSAIEEPTEPREPAAEPAPGLAPSPSFQLLEMSWDWQAKGSLLAKGLLSVARENEAAPASIGFEIPIADPPTRNVFEHPQDWVVSLLRRTMRA